MLSHIRNLLASIGAVVVAVMIGLAAAPASPTPPSTLTGVAKLVQPAPTAVYQAPSPAPAHSGQAVPTPEAQPIVPCPEPLNAITRAVPTPVSQIQP